MRRLARSLVIAIVLPGLTQTAAQSPEGEEIVVIGRKVRQAQAVYATGRAGLRQCLVQSSSGDQAFDARICVEARGCASAGFRRSRPMTQCVNERLLAWEKAKRQSEAPVPDVPSATYFGNRPDVPRLLPGSWDVRQTGAAAIRRICVRSSDTEATVLKILYAEGHEPELGRGQCAQWRFDRDGERFAGSRRCFQPGFRLDGKLSGAVQADSVAIEVRESSGASASELRESRNEWSARRTGNCA